MVFKQFGEGFSLEPAAARRGFWQFDHSTELPCGVENSWSQILSRILYKRRQLLQALGK